MQNMNYYYDFSGQKFEYPLSLSINQFDRTSFFKTIFFRNFLCFKKEVMKLLHEKMSTVIYETELAIIAP